jgi:hypothetical protein
MNSLAQDLAHVALIGIGATAVMDLWLWLLKRLHVPTLDFALVGRWIGHLARGRFSHAAIGKAPSVRGERALGWLTHYASGVAFAGLLVLLYGMTWTQSPTLAPALLVGIGTVLIPLFVMQPAMGAGIASSKTPTPWKNRARSLLTHAVFGAGLYVAAVAVEWISR